MGKDYVGATLGHLVKEDREATLIIKRLAKLLGEPAKAPPLRPCTIKVGKRPPFKSYTRRLTREQCAFLNKGSKTPNAMHKKLLKLLGKVNRAAALSWGRLLAALAPPPKVIGATPAPLGACDYTNLEGMGDCAPDMTQSQCDTLLNNHFRPGEGCGRPGHQRSAPL
jgi:hypothetical protein